MFIFFFSDLIAVGVCVFILKDVGYLCDSEPEPDLTRVDYQVVNSWTVLRC